MIGKKQKYYYAVVNRNGQLILDCGRLPIFWNKKVAIVHAGKFKGEVKRINHDDIAKSFLS